MPFLPGGEIVLAGAYNVTWNGAAVGMMEGDAGVPTLEQTTHVESINNSTTYGKSTVEGFYQGADWFASYTCLEFRPGSIAAFWPYSGTMGLMGTISRAMTDLAQALVLTAVAGTPSNLSGQPGSTSLTAGKAMLAPGFNGRLLYGPTLRKVPIRQILLPVNTGGGVVGWFTMV